MFPGSPGLCHPSFHSLPKHLSFKLRHGSQHVKCESARWQSGIDVLLQRHQIYSQRPALFRDAQQLFQRSRQPIQRPDHNDVDFPPPQIIHHGGQGWSVILGPTLAFIPVQSATPASPFTVFLQFVFLQVSFLLDRRNPHVNRCSLRPTHPLLPTARFRLFRPPCLAHRDFAAFLAISLRRLADNFFIRALADLRPIAEKYFDSLLLITTALYMLNGLA
jgi:hypothetical protein